MNFIRSLAFNILFYVWTGVVCLSCLPLLFFSSATIFKASRLWSVGIIWLCENILDLHFEIVGLSKVKDRTVIYAVKHQSSWETIVFQSILDHPAIALKKELTWIPFFGWYVQRLKMVPLSRMKGHRMKDLKKLLSSAKEALEQNRSIIIFPEGTRSLPGQKGKYYSGVSSLYHHLKIPVIPTAHNAGLYWPRRGFIKYPGTIKLEFLEGIEPGLSRQEFMHVLEDKIETTTNNLVAKGLNYATKS